MKRWTSRILVPVLGLGLLCAGAAQAEIPDHPDKLKFPPLRFDAPSAEDYRHTLSNGVPVFIVEDRDLPLVSVSITLRTGDFLDPADKPGLNELTGAMVRQGGTTTLSAEEFDEKVEFLAANINTFGGNTQSSAFVNVITPVLDEGLGLFFQMLRNPGFDEGRLQVRKDELLEELKQRNDDAGRILNRQWDWLLYGEDYFAAREGTAAELESIRRADLEAFHRKYWRPENMIIAVSGDVEAEAILAKLENHLKDWPGEGEAVSWPPPVPSHTPKAGLYHVEKDIPQGKVYIGHLTKQWNQWPDPDEPALDVMEHILGASGFTSRITKRVRSDEGLAYSAGASFSSDAFWPGDFRVSFQSKSPTVALAAKLALEEVNRIRDEKVEQEELEVAKNALVDSFPLRFESPQQVVSTFARDAYLGRDSSYWQSWRKRVEAVTLDDVQKVAQKYLKPEEMIFLVVGKWEEIEPGDADERATMQEFYGGSVQHLPLRDPLTLEALE
jgi:predicted Zn-dependent peptidase